jgi:acetyl-CoA carboxylase biotin carboxyl carrier protein
MTRIPMDPDAIRVLAGILTETGLTEIEIAEKDSRIRVVRAPGTMPPGGEARSRTAAPPAAALEHSPSEADDLASHPGAVLSPMVGVVYLSPEPSAPPFVTLGQAVSAGQTVLLIEAMKTFNHIKAPRAGTVARVLVANASPVEYGEPLMLIDD